MDYGQQLAQFIGDNQLLLGIIVGLVLLVIYVYKNKSSAKTISRAEVEREKRIKNISINEAAAGGNVYTGLFHGKQWLGHICSICNEKDDTGSALEIVFRPRWFYGIPHPTRKELLRIYDTELIKDPSRHALIILPTVSIDNFFGIHYDIPHSDENRNFIKAQIFKTDLESIGDIYFAESQKRATIDLERAAVITEKQMDLQIEREKRARLTQGT